MKELSREKILRELENWWREEENMKFGLLRAIALKGKGKDKYEEVVAELELRKQAFAQIKSLLTPIPEDKKRLFLSDKMYQLNDLMQEHGVMIGFVHIQGFIDKFAEEYDELGRG